MAERRRAQSTDSPPGLEETLRIDRDDLDGALIEQPDSYYKAAMAYVEAIALRDAAKLDLEHLEANLDVKIRDEAVAAAEKITENGIKQAMRLDARYMDASKQLLELSAQASRLGALKDAFRERRSSLGDLVTLAVGGLVDQSGARGGYESRAHQAEEARSMRPRRGDRYSRPEESQRG